MFLPCIFSWRYLVLTVSDFDSIVNKAEGLGSPVNIKGANKGCQDLGWKVHDRAKSFLLRSYTMY